MDAVLPWRNELIGGLDLFLEVTSARRNEVRNPAQFLPPGPKSELGSEVLSDLSPGPK